MESPWGCLNTRGDGSRYGSPNGRQRCDVLRAGPNGRRSSAPRPPPPSALSQRTGLETSLHQQRIAMNGHPHDPCGGLLWRICVAAAIPWRPGIETSLTITSGDSCSATSTSARPPCTSPTTSNRLEQPRQECRRLRGGRGSSTRRPNDCSSLSDRTRHGRARQQTQRGHCHSHGRLVPRAQTALAPICLGSPERHLR
jgi:hypothetical protein